MTAPEVTREEAERRVGEHVPYPSGVSAGCCQACTRAQDSAVRWPCSMVVAYRTVVALYDEISEQDDLRGHLLAAEAANQRRMAAMRECIARLRDGWMAAEFGGDRWPHEPGWYWHGYDGRNPVRLTPEQQAVMARG